MDTLDKILEKVDGAKVKKEIREWGQNFLKKIEDEKARTHTIIETAVDGIITINGKGIIQSLNKSAEKIFGYSSDELIGHNVNVLMPEPYKSNHDSYIENYFRTGRKISIGKGVEALALKKDGSIFPIYLAVSEVKSSSPEEHIFVGIIQDITRRKEAEEKLSLALQSAEMGIWSLQLPSYSLMMDEMMCSLLELDRKEFSGSLDDFLDFMEPLDKDRFGRELEKAIKEGKKLETECRVVTEGGNTRILSSKAIILYDATKKPFIMIGVANDLQSSQRTSGLYDLKTGLPNFDLVFDRAKIAKSFAKRMNTSVAFIYIGFNKFELVRGMYEYQDVENLLKEIGSRLEKALRESDTVGKLAGEDFIIIFPLDQFIDASTVYQRTIKALEKPFIINDREVRLEPCIGVSIFPEDGENPKTLINNANIAMTLAKESFTQVGFYNKEMGEKVEQLNRIQSNLRNALVENQFFLMYQPIVDIRNGNVVGLEALARWKHPEQGFIYPDQFIPLIENDRIVHEFGEYVLNYACQQNKAWQEDGLDKVYVSVNVSAKQFLNPNFPNIVTSVLEHSKLDPKYLRLEVTETGLVNDPEKARKIMLELQEKGIEFMMDDFGTGYASHRYLQDFPFAGLKIDRSFVDGFVKDEKKYSILKSAIELTRDFNMICVAEGIEDEQTFSFLKVMRCGYAQGYLISKPMEVSDAPEFLKEYLFWPKESA